MYHDFYQLKENPFNVTADPDFFFSSKCHREGISHLQYGIDQRKGILVLTGEVGTGKTTLCRRLLQTSNDKTKYALILNPNFSELQLLQLIIQDFGIVTKQKTKFGLIQVLNEFLIAESNRGNNIVVIIDEAQQLGVKQLEQIRLLSNLETEKEKLLQLILIGQPELHDKLQLMALRQLRQRIALHFHVAPLDKADTDHYVRYRLTKAQRYPDTAKNLHFTPQAIDMIYRYTQGTPRTINLLCDRALLAGFAAEQQVIDERIIEACAKEVLYCEHHL